MLAYLLSLLDKEVSEHVRKSKQFFELIADFVASVSLNTHQFLLYSLKMPRLKSISAI